MLYYWAISKLFPEYKHKIVTILFLRDGGPYSMCFEDDVIAKTEKIIKEHFDTVLADEKPKPINKFRSDFRCVRLCHFYKNNFPGTDTMFCKHVENQVDLYGIEDATKKLRKPGFAINTYVSPGTIEGR